MCAPVYVYLYVCMYVYICSHSCFCLYVCVYKCMHAPFYTDTTHGSKYRQTLLTWIIRNSVGVLNANERRSLFQCNTIAPISHMELRRYDKALGINRWHTYHGPHGKYAA